MSTVPEISSTLLLTAGEFLADVMSGLSRSPRSLSAKYFYDEAGSSLFDQICELNEYYPTRVETEIMSGWAGEMAERLGPNVRLIEFGSGSSVKTRLLLDHLDDPSVYAPVDISGEHLTRTAAGLAVDYPLLEISPLVADFTKPFRLRNHHYRTSRSCVYFPGSTIGNFAPDAALQLLAGIPRPCGDGLLIGFDLQKDVDVIEAAYNDAAGVTAAFNKNLLRRINSELGGNFAIDQFQHLAFYNDVAERIEMHLVSECEQLVCIGDQDFPFARGETIRTEYSHKYTVDGFTKLAARAGWRRRDVWTDPRNYFAVMYLER